MCYWKLGDEELARMTMEGMKLNGGGRRIKLKLRSEAEEGVKGQLAGMRSQEAVNRRRERKPRGWGVCTVLGLTMGVDAQERVSIASRKKKEKEKRGRSAGRGLLL